MKFSDSYPEFQSNTTKNYITDQLHDELKKFILDYADTTKRLTVVCIDLAERLSIEPIRATLDWTLRQAYFEDLFTQLRKKSFTCLMDFLGDFAELYFDTNARQKLNSLLIKQNFKYVLTIDMLKGPIWESIQSNQIQKSISVTHHSAEKVVDSIERNLLLIQKALNKENFLLEVKNIFQNIEQEILSYTGTSSIEDAFNLMNNTAEWGGADIIKEGQHTYSYLKNILNDQFLIPDNFDLLYWIEKLELFRSYLALKIHN